MSDLKIVGFRAFFVHNFMSQIAHVVGKWKEYDAFQGLKMHNFFGALRQANQYNFLFVYLTRTRTIPLRTRFEEKMERLV
uniref:Uncharacterized protein n=1 Tax=Romanomermis culicivorax TaxID=13658 RepID=A0A915HJX4_ROMCU